MWGDFSGALESDNGVIGGHTAFANLQGTQFRLYRLSFSRDLVAKRLHDETEASGRNNRALLWLMDSGETFKLGSKRRKTAQGVESVQRR